MSKHLLLSFTLFVTLFLALSACKNANPERVDNAQPGPVRVGDTAPDFTLPAADGGKVSLSELVAKTNVLLYFNMAYG